MISTDNLCMSCMRDIGSAKQCPYCGYHVDSVQIAPYLPVRTVISNRYLVGKLLEYNGEGATYIGWDMTEKKAVNIREFIPENIAMRTTSDLTLRVQQGSELVFRDCAQSFGEMWSKLMHLQGLPALINVTDVCRDYGTLFAVYDYIEGVTLREYLLSSKTGYVSWERARQLLMPILSTLGSLHSSGIIHRGISPTTLIVGKDGKMRITGFSVWQARTARGDLSAQLFPGYAAIEQYGFDGQQGAWTDIYSFGAVLYRTLTGSDPVEANHRVTDDTLTIPGKFAETLPPYVISGLVSSMQILPEDRTQNAEQLRAELSASPISSSTESRYTLSAREASASRIAPPDVSEEPYSEDDDEDEYEPLVDRRTEWLTTLKTMGIAVLVGLAIMAVIFVAALIKGNIDANKEANAGVSSQGEMVAVPDFVTIGKSADEIQSDPYYSANFSFTCNYRSSDTIPKGKVISQNITVGEKVVRGTTITLTVSSGTEKILLSQDIIGKQFDEVYEQLTSVGFKIVKEEVSSGVTAADGAVVGCKSHLNASYEKGTEIILQVYKVPETTLPPETLPEEPEETTADEGEEPAQTEPVEGEESTTSLQEGLEERFSDILS